MKVLNRQFAVVILVIFLLFSCKKSSQTNSGWIELGGNTNTTFNNPIGSIATDARGNVYAAGNFTNGNGYEFVAKWDGTAWSELGGTNTSTFNYWINSISTDANGNVYAGGVFSNGPNYLTGNKYIAKRDGTKWSELGDNNNSTFNGRIGSIATDVNGNVYAACVNANSYDNPFIAKWNEAAWSELGGINDSMVNGRIFSITTDANGNIYAAVSFTNGNNSNGKYYVAKWNGTAWSELGGSNDF